MAGASVDREVLDLIRQIILEEASRLGIGVERIILFGSRARGDYREDSDWDILIVVRGEVGWRTRMRFWRNVYRRLRPLLGKPLDLIIEPEQYYRMMVGERVSFESVITGEGVHA
ncbi:MAG: nucleotidyltransferase domain-containing protein [Desulfurococcales archaeon]|nr:nucleotidyltransferase domain-containing protein [Desulfurococcales archaeon]